MYPLLEHKSTKVPWNKGKLIGQKPPLKLKDIWAIRIRLQLEKKVRDLALFNLAIDSKLRACDLLKLKVSDISHGNSIAPCHRHAAMRRSPANRLWWNRPIVHSHLL